MEKRRCKAELGDEKDGLGRQENGETISVSACLLGMNCRYNGKGEFETDRVL